MCRAWGAESFCQTKFFSTTITSPSKLENNVTSHTFYMEQILYLIFVIIYLVNFKKYFQKSDRDHWALQLCSTSNLNPMVTLIFKIQYKNCYNTFFIHFDLYLAFTLSILFVRRGKLFTDWSYNNFVKLVKYYNKAIFKNLLWCKAEDLDSIFRLWQGSTIRTNTLAKMWTVITTQYSILQSWSQWLCCMSRGEEQICLLHRPSIYFTSWSKFK